MELIKFLHVRGADITTSDQHGATPLHYSVLMCAEHDQQQQQQQQRDEEMQSSREDDDVVDRLIPLSVLRTVLTRTEIIDSFDQQRRTALTWAASCGNLLSVHCIVLRPIMQDRPRRLCVLCQP